MRAVVKYDSTLLTHSKWRYRRKKTHTKNKNTNLLFKASYKTVLWIIIKTTKPDSSDRKFHMISCVRLGIP